MTARSVLLAATPAASPTVPSMAALFGVASNSAVNAPVCVANAVFCHVAELVRHAPGGGGAVTVTLAVPLCPSLVAVIVAAPGATAVTRRLPLTVATAVFPLAHVITRPPSAFPLASFGVAVSCTVCPCGIATVGGVTATDATGTLATVTDAVPLCPSLVAVIVAAPGATAVTRPLPLTVATALFPLAHVITRPPRAFPLASCGVAVSCTVCPCGIVTAGGVTATAATGTLATVTDAVPLCPSLVAVIVAAPGATAVTRPLPLTVATALFPLAHVITRPPRAFPLASCGVAVSCTVCPCGIVTVGGVTATAATGTLATVTDAVPLCPSLVAVIVAAPGATAVTRPLPLTVATALFPLAHVITRPPRAFPLASCGVAVSCTVCPCGIVTAGGVTATAATGTLATVTDAVPLFPSLVAVIVAAPTATPRTMPLPSTLATPGALLPQVTARPLRGFPFGSSGVAANCIVAPTTTVPDGGVTATTATAVVLGAVPTGFSHAYTARSAAATVAETTNNGRDRMRGLRIGFLSRASVAGATAGVGDGRACDGPALASRGIRVPGQREPIGSGQQGHADALQEPVPAGSKDDRAANVDPCRGAGGPASVAAKPR